MGVGCCVVVVTGVETSNSKSKSPGKEIQRFKMIERIEEK